MQLQQKTKAKTGKTGVTEKETKPSSELKVDLKQAHIELFLKEDGINQYQPDSLRSTVHVMLSYGSIYKWWLSNNNITQLPFIVFMQIGLTTLISTNRIQNNFCFKVTLVTMLSSKTKD